MKQPPLLFGQVSRVKLPFYWVNLAIAADSDYSCYSRHNKTKELIPC